jgi:phosphoribosyl 1,2-cyclic phosphodiesterase
MNPFSVKFWGVRGSVPAPGQATSRYGGNTSCVEVRVGDQFLIFDMGSGIRALGESLGGAKVDATMFVSHYHWDHIQGLPFFGSVYSPKNSFTIYGPSRAGQAVRNILAGQMVAPYFPVPLDVFGARLDFRSIASRDVVQTGDVRITARELHHPGGVLAYRIDHGGKSLVYATDNEHGTGADDELAEFSRNADCLIFDAMYTPDEYAGRGVPPKTGWGHSTWEEAVKMVRRARVKRLVLFHHEPKRSDAGVEEILALTRAQHRDTLAAREGEILEL